MSAESAELRAIAEAAYGALNAGDLDRFLAVIAEDVEFTSMIAEMEGVTFKGHDGVRTWWRTVAGAFEGMRWELLEIDGTTERAVSHLLVTGVLGGAKVEQMVWQAVTFRDGKVRWWEFFRSERDARKAAGLIEE